MIEAPQYPQLVRLLNEITAYATDVTALLPSDWQVQLASVSSARSVWQTLEGGSMTSREEAFEDVAEAHVGVVTGDYVADTLPWLDSLYRNEFLDLANTLGPEKYEVSGDLRSGVNINTTRRGARYEWHVDSNPLTALLFGTSHTPEQGGQLVFRPDPVARPSESWHVEVSPRAGTLLLFDAREAAHVVTEVLEHQRISVPMNLYIAGRQERPSDLDEYLYG